MHVVANEETILKITFSDQPIVENPNRLTEIAVQQLSDYFDGRRKHFDLPLSAAGTHFQQKVMERVAEIPFGKTISYTQLSQFYGDAKAIRAVAAANGKNQFAIVVPCHRVLGASGKLTGYAWGLDKKQWLLAHEGSGTGNLFG